VPIDPAAIATLPLFRRLTPADRGRIAAVAASRTYARGERLFDEGDTPDDLFIVTAGRVKVFKHGPVGHDVILEIFGPGDPIGAVAVYESRPYPASAAALEVSTCLRIPSRPFFELLEASPTLVRGLLSGLSLRLVELTTRLAELTSSRVDVRLARLFLKLSDRIGRADRGGVFIPLPLSRQELADLAGTTIETAIRIMSRWGKADVLRTEPDGFTVVDRANLEKLAGE
jgi:CRP-like cAMP-binding protein